MNGDVQCVIAQYERAVAAIKAADEPEARAFWRRIRDQNAVVLRRCGVLA